jgi:hypothetical protein
MRRVIIVTYHEVEDEVADELHSSYGHDHERQSQTSSRPTRRRPAASTRGMRPRDDG